MQNVPRWCDKKAEIKLCRAADDDVMFTADGFTTTKECLRLCLKLGRLKQLTSLSRTVVSLFEYQERNYSLFTISVCGTNDLMRCLWVNPASPRQTGGIPREYPECSINRKASILSVPSMSKFIKINNRTPLSRLQCSDLFVLRVSFFVLFFPPQLFLSMELISASSASACS